MSRFVMAVYTPKPGKEQPLIAVVKRHLNVLHAEGLVTDKPAYVMRAADGTIVEVFEWRSAEAIGQAHTNPSALGRVRYGLRLHAAGQAEGIPPDVRRVRRGDALRGT